MLYHIYVFIIDLISLTLFLYYLCFIICCINIICLFDVDYQSTDFSLYITICVIIQTEGITYIVYFYHIISVSKI